MRFAPAVSDWWLKYVYLRSRSSLLLGSNYYGMDFAWHLPTSKQAARAACVSSLMLELAQRINREQLEPMLLQGAVPLCMAQYAHMYVVMVQLLWRL